MWATRQRDPAVRPEDDPVPAAVEELPYTDAPRRARHGADLGSAEQAALAESYDRQVRGGRRAYAEPGDGGEPWDGDPADTASWDERAGSELTRARLLSFTPYQPKRDRLCTDTASLLRPLVRAGIIDTWATDHSYPAHRAWKLLPSRLAMPQQLPLDGYVEPDGGITLVPLPEAYDEPPLCMLDWVIDWTAAGRLDSRWWTTAVHVTASAGLPPTGTLRPFRP
ncbi:hypothetical protein Cme02nite_46400 [Catellatospora methionotrophica]|uniref:Uncharacterized protein n=1 Tax=Catellatospora methionotrophica TaxID=121620 RepID=A0A8J3PHD4_9ACTN|nr:hypothetical protein [Catellatospora methionotrophica]GIG16308.1 hypothetical protein Cme02nite_46400 [Catellatospora methionotrophica]